MVNFVGFSGFGLYLVGCTVVVLSMFSSLLWI